MLAADYPLLAAPGERTVVDVGVGAMPWTTAELARALTEALPGPPAVIGIDIDDGVVARAQSLVPEVKFVSGDLAVPGVQARLVRVLNVLRNQPAEAVPRAHATLGQMLVEGGILIEGSCHPDGDVGVVHRIRKRDGRLHREALWMWTEGRTGCAPILFRDRLPRDLRRSVQPSHALGQLMLAWMDAFGAVGAAFPGIARFDQSVIDLGWPELTLLGSGAVQWAPHGGVPPPLP